LDGSTDARKKSISAACAVALASWICLFGHLGALGLVGPDEPRYAWIARAMAQTGDWVTPRLFGSPWFEKPILYYWTAAVGFKLHVPAEWAARLPSAIAALAAAISIGWLGARFERTREFCPWSAALLAPMFFSTSAAAIAFARAATPDMLFAASITLAMASAASVLEVSGVLRGAANALAVNRSRNRGAVVCFGVCLGLGVLAKGPAAILLAGGAVAIWALGTHHWSRAFRLLHPYAIGSFSVVALPWYIICARRNPDFVRIFIFQHNFERYVTPLFQHRQPFWFFIPITLLAALPWTAFLIPAACDGLRLWRRKTWRDSPAFFFACWAVFPTLFFSFSQSKLPGYILPGMPALALVMSVSAASLMERSSKEGSLTCRWLGFTWIGLAAGGLAWLHRLPKPAAIDTGPQMIVCVVLAAAGGIGIAILAQRRQRATMWASLALVSLLVEIAGIAILPKLDPLYSARLVGTWLRDDRRPDRLFVYKLPRAWQYGVAFYLGSPLPDWQPRDPEAALLVTTCEEFYELKNEGYFRGSLDEPCRGVFLVPIPTRPTPTR
jgi:4-amino-4-deoxy-L-arabinose transferase-like glycosyltransferase